MDGPCVSFQDLIIREKNRARGGASPAEIKREKLLVSRSVAGTQERYGERGDEREGPREKEDKLLRLDKGQNCLYGTGNG